MPLNFTTDPIDELAIHRRASARAEGENVVLTFPVNGDFLNLTLPPEMARQLAAQMVPVTVTAEVNRRRKQT